MTVFTLAASVSMPSQAQNINSPSAMASLRARMPVRAFAEFQALIARQAARASPTPLLDVTPPTLTAFKPPKAVKVSQSQNPIEVSFRATDDQSGVSAVFAYAYGAAPPQQFVSVEYTNFPMTSVASNLGEHLTSAFLAPGEYDFTYAIVLDESGNYAEFDQAQLTALGRSKFSIKNDKGFDAQTPILAGGGSILTPTAHLFSGYAAISVNLPDQGDTVAAGTRRVVAQFVSVDLGSSFLLEGWDKLGPRRDEAPIVSYGRLDRNLASIGEHHLRYLLVEDYAGNSIEFTSTQFGGSTDFSQFFDSTVINVVP